MNFDHTFKTTLFSGAQEILMESKITRFALRLKERAKVNPSCLSIKTIGGFSSCGIIFLTGEGVEEKQSGDEVNVRPILLNFNLVFVLISLSFFYAICKLLTSCLLNDISSIERESINFEFGKLHSK